MIDIYPLTIVKDRYGGCYSGGAFTAWNMSFDEIPTEIDSNDVACCMFWDSFESLYFKNGLGAKVYVGKGKTIQEAVDDLIKQKTK